MLYLRVIISFLLSAVAFYGLNTKFGSLPPIGKFLSPSQGVWQNENNESITGDIQIDNLIAKVTVHYDKQLIPHIFAENESDLYRAQGYVTAKHRLWQMEFQTHAAAGRLSEIFGESTLEFDRTTRRKGLGYGAENAIKIINNDPEILNIVEAYRDGVNSYINSLDPSEYPVEYKLLDYAPEAWTIEKTALLLMYMTNDLAGRDSDLENTNALRKFGRDRFDVLYPDFFDVNDPIIPKEEDWSFVETKMTETPESEFLLDSISKTMTKPHPNNGSNNWAVSGDKSYSGNPILANDPHLGLNLPSVWFVIQLSTPEYSVYGASLPGALGVVSGFNKHIAWGETNATRDALDWYKVEFKDDSRQEYKFAEGWKKTRVRVEEIKIRNEKTFIDSVLYTHHGPVSYDKNFMGDEKVVGYAMKWIGHQIGNTQRTFLELNRGKTYDDYVNALTHYTAPAQNFVFASTSGDIAIWVQGLFPNKWKGQGKFLLDGSNPEHDWQGYIPQEYNAHTKNPERGFVSSANQHPVDQSYPFYVFNDSYETYRNRVINNFFNSKQKFTIDDFKSLQTNNYNLKASEIVPHIILNMETASLTSYEKKLFDIIKSWDYYNESEAKAPCIWDEWWNKLDSLTWDELNVEGEVFKKPFTYQTIHMLKNMPNDKFMDILRTPKIETSKDLFLISFKEAAKELKAWETENGEFTWREYKATFVGHLLKALPAFSRFNLPVGGSKNSVNAVSENHGPSWRLIVEMASTPQAIFIYPGGQSGNPGSVYYDNYIDKWAAGEYYQALFMKNKNATKYIIGTQLLIPAS
ncbi:MAG: penicillin amidase [Crocinitomicaceae bacterium]|jgi:penicillin amidase